MLSAYDPLSMIDDPRGAAIVLYNNRCNLRCPYCHNKDFTEGQNKDHDLEEIVAKLEKRKGIIDYVVISGGEPTFGNHDQTLELLPKIVEMGYKIKLDTNGTNPNILKQILDTGHVSYVAMDIKASFSDYTKLSCSKVIQDWPGSRIEKSFSIILEAIEDKTLTGYELRTTCVYPFVTVNAMNMIINALSLRLGTRKIPAWYLQKARLSETCLDINYPDMKALSIEEINTIKTCLEHSEIVDRVFIR